MSSLAPVWEPCSKGGKFCPVSFDPEKHLRRDLKYLRILAAEGSLPSFLFLEGQAGQGKTTLAAQLLNELSWDGCWYTLDEADQSALYFLGSLLSGLKATVRDFVTPVDAVVRSGDVPETQACALLEKILAVLGSKLESKFVLVLDDIHQCPPSSETFSLLQVLINHAPPLLHTVFIGRRDMAPLIDCARRQGSVVHLGTPAMAFSASETAALFNSRLKLPLTRAAIKSLWQTTAGWVMGLQLAARGLHGLDAADIERETEALKQHSERIFDYLFTQVFAGLTPARRDILMVLSLLEEIPVGLARKMTGYADIHVTLSEIAGENCFMQAMDGNRTSYVLHQLFRSKLRQRARQEKKSQELHRLYGLAADWHQLEHPELSIRYHLAGEAYAAAENSLRQACLHYPLQDRLAGLRVLLGELPDGIIAEHAWLAYYRGVGLMGEVPAKAYPFLHMAHAQFVQRGDELGELLSGAQLMLFSVGVDGNYARGYPLLDRSMTLFAGCADSLPPLVYGHMANIALLANTFLRFAPALAEQFFEEGLGVARREEQLILEIEARIARLYYLIFSGDWSRCRQELEAALPLLHNPLCSPFQQGAISLAQLAFLKGSGDFDAYDRTKHWFRARIDESLREGSVGEAYLLFWDLQIHCACGDRAQAAAVLNAAAGAKGAAATPHLKNLFLQYAALLAAEEGQSADALAAIELARTLRTQCGGLYYHDLNDAFFGATYDLLGDDAQALACFERALGSSSRYLRETALAFRARYYQRRRDPRVLEDLRALLESLRVSGYAHFYGWFPEFMTELLSLAVTAGVETETARQVAAQRLHVALLEDGTPLPLLDVVTLGEMRFCLHGRTVLHETGLSEAQRQLLAMLLSLPSQSCSQKRLQLLFWPESDERKARNSFDQMLSRLRKTFEAAFGENARHYLQLKHGMLSLCHCCVDAPRFLELVRQGTSHFLNKQFWQAESLLHKAMTLYQGEFLVNAPDHELVESRRVELLESFQSGAILYADILHQRQRTQQAISLLEQSFAADPLHDPTVKKLYALHIHSAKPSRAQQLLDQYRETLRREGYLPSEVRETMDSFWN